MQHLLRWDAQSPPSGARRQVYGKGAEKSSDPENRPPRRTQNARIFLSGTQRSLYFALTAGMDSLKGSRKILPAPVATAVLLYKGTRNYVSTAVA